MQKTHAENFLVDTSQGGEQASGFLPSDRNFSLF